MNTIMNTIRRSRELKRRLALIIAGGAVMLALGSIANASSPPMVAISNVPLVLVQPTDPQVLVVLPNSQSMDGDLSGAIMTGSGIVGSLHGSSSPVNYTVPAGFTAPVQNAVAGQAPYTVNSGGTLYDNSASRLNVAKQSIQKVLQQYAPNFDFGLMTYNTSGLGRYTTWVYYMSGSGGFAFGDSGDTPPAGTRWIPNPCYQSNTGYCNQIAWVLGSGARSQPDMAIAASSDDADINDVLYAGGLSPVCLDYGGHNPPTPYPPYRTLGQYNSGNILVGYYRSTGYCATQTGPTNAGYVPFSSQVMYSERGFGFYVSSQSRNSGDILVPVAPAATNGAPTPAQISTYIAKFTPYLAPETNRGTSEIKALAVQSPIAGLMRWANKYYTSGASGYPKPPSNNGCTPHRYVVMITDGLPTEDLDGQSWPPLGTASSEGYGVHATFNLVGGGTVADTDPNFASDVQAGETTTLASTNDQALQDAIDQLDALKSNQIQTYIVGMGAGVDPTKNPAAAATMKAMALAGGTSNYFPGVTPQDVVNDMQIIFAQIQAANQSTTTVAVNSTSFQSNQAVYQARFDTASFGWTGNLVAFPVMANGTVDQLPADQLWDARSWMQTAYAGTGWDTNRLAVTMNSATDTAVPFRWGNLSSTQKTEFETYWNTLTVSQQSTFFGNSQSNYGKAVLNYLRGDQALTQSSSPNGGPFRDRSYLLGDIVNSAPLYVAAPNGVYPGNSYSTFAHSHASRKPVIYVGSNDGAVHAFDASNGHEIFAFFPRGPFSKLPDLTLPGYNSNHEFFVDGSPNAGDVQFADGSWHSLLVGGLNAGGAGIYALNITNPSNWTSESAVASDVLWDITSATPGFSHLGLTYSQPQIVQIACNGINCNSSGNTFAVIFGSGYNNDNGNPYLYVVNAETGALIKAFDLCSANPSQCSSSLANGLSTPVVVSSTGTTVSDRVYAGDLQGNLWRVDLSDPNPTNWSATVLFKAQNGGNDQPITTQPVVSFAPPGAGGGIMVYFGTGEYLGPPDIVNTGVQNFYGVLDKSSTIGLPFSSSLLKTVTLSTTTVDGQQVRVASGSPINWSSGDRGWKMPLPDLGERMITTPRLIGGRVVFTTFTPSKAACSAGGFSWLMIVNYATGGQLPGPELDLNNDGQLNGGDQAPGGVNPVGLSLGPGYAASPTIVAYHQGPFNDLKLITVSGSPIKSIKERGQPRGVLSWSEIR
ncbi:MAG: PilC/PilY family type IV pilus protein [Gammaproteobacteria bacterium]